MPNIKLISKKYHYSSKIILIPIPIPKPNSNTNLNPIKLKSSAIKNFANFHQCIQNVANFLPCVQNVPLFSWSPKICQFSPFLKNNLTIWPIIANFSHFLSIFHHLAQIPIFLIFGGFLAITF